MERGRHAARRIRALRGVTAATVAVIVAATAHTLSGGAAPPLWLLVAVSLLAAPLAVWLVGAAPALWRTGVVVAVSQALLHTAFAAVGTDAPARGLAHSHGVVVLGIGSAGASVDAAMIAGHGVAAMVTTVLLAWGERMLRALGRGIRRLLSRAPVRDASFPSAPRDRLAPSSPVTRRVPLASLSRRGPPVFAH